MATYTNPKPYVKAPRPSVPESTPKWTDEELRKIEITLKQILVIIQELVDQKVDVP